MTIYVLAYNNLLKIGFTKNLTERVYNISIGLPGDVQCLGHMPGGRDLEAHLHERFGDYRFSGEWFHDCDVLRTFFRLALNPGMPPKDKKVREIGTRREKEKAETKRAKLVLRQYAAMKRPTSSHGERKTFLAEHLDWLKSRVDDLYGGAPRIVVRACEIGVINQLEHALSALATPETGRAEG